MFFFNLLVSILGLGRSVVGLAKRSNFWFKCLTNHLLVPVCLKNVYSITQPNWNDRKHPINDVSHLYVSQQCW